MVMTRRITGKDRLDDLSLEERRAVYNHIAAIGRSAEPPLLAAPYETPEQLAARQCARDKETAELRMRGGKPPWHRRKVRRSPAIRGRAQGHLVLA
jgi:hypothetical protein